jgi:ketosteroid isomerase-like protein
MFDVPAPVQLKGIDAYRRSWEVFFTHQGKGGAFNLGELQIATGHDVAFCHAILTCGGADPADQFPVRLTIGLRKVDNAWVVTHEHHSVPATASL